MSTRALQRALTDAGTTFRAEVRGYQLARAKHLLRANAQSVSWIAAEVGFSSLQHFSAAFRRATGETPGSFRTRHAGRASGEALDA
jgi:AraC-like DNA-binding protein